MTARWDTPPRTRKRTTTRRAAERGTFRCCGAHGCGVVLVDVTVRAAERHADAHGGARLDIVVDP